MKIVIPANRSDLNAKVERMLGMSDYLLVIDTKTMSFEAIPGPSESSGPGSGIRALALVLGKDVRTVLTGYISPDIARTLRENGIEVITSVEGKVRDAVERYKRGDFDLSGNGDFPKTIKSPPGEKLRVSLKKTTKQFSTMLPILAAVILLVGLFRAFVSRDMLFSLFSGRPFLDTFLGALLGSVFTGNPVNSYVIGETLLKMGVNMFAVTAFIVAWVNVGLVQLPAEISALGGRFAVIRNVAAFIISILIAMLTVFVVGLIG